MKNLFPYRPDLVKLGGTLRKFSLSFGVTGSIFDHFDNGINIFWIVFSIFMIGAIGEAMTTLYSKSK